MNKKSKIFLIILSVIFIVIIGVLVVILYKIKLEGKPDLTMSENDTQNDKKIIFDNTKDENTLEWYNGNDRPIAVMIDNHSQAMPHAGLSKAYLVYEIIVEGGESRLMALFKGQNLDKIGPVRSSRHYFLDYAMENDAIYVHYGWSPEAESDIKEYGINNINGIYDDSYFSRVKDKVAPHNAVISTKKILEAAKAKNYRTTSTAKPVLNYVTDEVDLGNNAQSANIVKFSYSAANTVKWEYDSQNKVYERYSKGKKEVEWDTGKEVTVKNIIIEFIKNTDLTTSADDEKKGRQTMTTTGIKDGYYITNGKAIKITCEKTSRKAKTVYKDQNGNEINVNDGNTFIEICPIDSNVKFESNEEKEGE